MLRWDWYVEKNDAWDSGRVPGRGQCRMLASVRLRECGPKNFLLHYL